MKVIGQNVFTCLGVSVVLDKNAYSKEEVQRLLEDALYALSQDRNDTENTRRDFEELCSHVRKLEDHLEMMDDYFSSKFKGDDRNNG